MPTFQYYWNELLSWVPQLDPQLAQKLVNRAWRDIQDTRQWSFNLVQGNLTTPAVVTSGSITAVQGSASIVGDATAAAAWLAIGAPALIQRQFRVVSGPIYNITAFDGVDTLTLDRVYAESNFSAATYQIYQVYYPPPDPSFLRWVSFLDAVNGFPLITDWTKQEIDRIDPKRGATGLPYRVASFRVNPAYAATTTFTGQVMFELWPGPTGLFTYVVLYQRRGIDFASQTSILPTPVRDETLMERAKLQAFEWAMANAGAHQSLKGTNWMALMAATKASYMENLNQDIRQDEETFQMLLTGNYVFNFRGNVMLSHLPQFGPWFSSGSGYPY